MTIGKDEKHGDDLMRKGTTVKKEQHESSKSALKYLMGT